MKKIKSSSPESSESIFKGNNDKSSTPSADKISINDIMEAFDEIDFNSDNIRDLPDISMKPIETNKSSAADKFKQDNSRAYNGGSTGSDSGAHNL